MGFVAPGDVSSQPRISCFLVIAARANAAHFFFLSGSLCCCVHLRFTRPPAAGAVKKKCARSVDMGDFRVLSELFEGHRAGLANKGTSRQVPLHFKFQVA